MDYKDSRYIHVASIFIVASIYVLISFLYGHLLLRRDIVALCSNGQNIVVVMRLGNDMNVVIPSKSYKDTLGCLRRGMSYYDRHIEYIDETNTSKQVIEGLKTRYKVGRIINASNSKLIFPYLIIQNDILVLQQEKYAIYLRTLKNPFGLSDIVKKYKLSKLFCPPLTKPIQKILSKYEKLDKIVLFEGDSIVIGL